mmetsp:Transcript_5200/g.12802  ORF Transcript_5200/g.12802 Transcript_5200/m.12802 type:complete len:369 (-) Transcript_5200:925-2031(-)
MCCDRDSTEPRREDTRVAADTDSLRCLPARPCWPAALMDRPRRAAAPSSAAVASAELGLRRRGTAWLPPSSAWLRPARGVMRCSMRAPSVAPSLSCKRGERPASHVSLLCVPSPSPAVTCSAAASVACEDARLDPDPRSPGGRGGSLSCGVLAPSLCSPTSTTTSCTPLARPAAATTVKLPVALPQGAPASPAAAAGTPPACHPMSWSCRWSADTSMAAWLVPALVSSPPTLPVRPWYELRSGTTEPNACVAGCSCEGLPCCCCSWVPKVAPSTDTGCRCASAGLKPAATLAPRLVAACELTPEAVCASVARCGAGDRGGCTLGADTGAAAAAEPAPLTAMAGMLDTVCVGENSEGSRQLPRTRKPCP